MLDGSKAGRLSRVRETFEEEGLLVAAAIRDRTFHVTIPGLFYWTCFEAGPGNNLGEFEERRPLCAVGARSLA